MRFNRRIAAALSVGVAVALLAGCEEEGGSAPIGGEGCAYVGGERVEQVAQRGGGGAAGGARGGGGGGGAGKAPGGSGSKASPGSGSGRAGPAPSAAPSGQTSPKTAQRPRGARTVS